MNSQEKFAEATGLTEKWGQQHLLRFFGELDAEKQDGLLDSILQTDFELLSSLYQKARKEFAKDTVASHISPAKVQVASCIRQSKLEEARALGLEAFARGQYAVVTMAGGQGTRLGCDGPKGTYRILLDTEKTLFEVQLDRIAGMSLKVGKPIPWYIMTSDENHAATVRFFEENSYFGYRDIAFFRQSSLPMLGLDGKILLDEKHKLKEGPDGNGSVFRSMLTSGVAEDMRRRGVQWFFMCNVDNILTQCVDPLPVGMAMKAGLLCASKSVMKRNPEERAGVFCRVGGRPAVIEYTELPAELAKMTEPDGELVYGDAHISCTVFNIGVLELNGAIHMPYHTAVKKSACILEDGSKLVPQKENAYKFEAFIFDVFPSLDDMVVLRVNREDEFAPIKNASGDDSPETARALYMNHLKKENRL